MKKNPGYNYLVAGAFMLVLCLLIGCAQDPVRFTQPGAEIWNLNFTFANAEVEIKNQRMFLIPSQTEKGVFSVVAEISSKIDPPEGPYGVFFTKGKWKGEVRNGIFVGETDRIADTHEGPGYLQGSVKGTFSGTRASGTFRESAMGLEVYGKWTAQKIS
jgi:hypothetical protein